MFRGGAIGLRGHTVVLGHLRVTGRRRDYFLGSSPFVLDELVFVRVFASVE